MRSLHTIAVLLFSMFFLSCSSSDDTNDPVEGPTSQATINGGTFSNYVFKLGVYEVVKNKKNNTLNIEMADKNGKKITLFLNSTDGFESGTIKQMGNVDSEKFSTYAWIRDVQPQASYYSNSGTLKITNNRENPSNSKQNIISGAFEITAYSEDLEKNTTMKGSFTDLVYIK